jgi:diguanylate cyclase (GGDEF)-like protein
MTDNGSINRTKRAVFELGFLRGSIPQILVWPILCLILAVVLWYWTISKIDAEKHALEVKALAEASALSKDYAQYLAQVIEEANQITLQLKFGWEKSHGNLNLQELSQSGIFRSAQIINVLILNREGIPATATIPALPNISMADRDYFVFHKGDDSDALLIGKPRLGRLSGKPIIPFSRRLSTQRGAFDGVAVVSFAPSYLTAFYAGSFPGKTGLLAVAGLDGILRSVKIGNEPDSTPAVLRTVPLFASQEGASYLSEVPWSGDKLARFVAWKTLKDYPLVVMAGIPEQEYFAPQLEAWATYKKAAALGTFVMFLSAFAATGMSARLARKKYQEEEVRKAYRVATEGGNEGFYMYEALRDKNGAIVDFVLVDCNEHGAAFYGTTQMQLLQTKISSFYPTHYFDELMNTFLSAMESGFYEVEFRPPHESMLKIEWAKTRLVRSGNGLAVTIQDITERKLAEEKIEFLAHHDPLTRLPNRVLLRDRFEQAMAIARREDSGVVLMFLDLDHFKQINDSFGHQLGDQVLLKIVKRLQECIRDADTICRQGGDEFIIVLTNIKDLNDIGRIAQNMLDAVCEPIEIEKQTFHTSASIGITLFPNDGGDFDTLLKNADTAMYQAKDSGRNAYRFFTAKMNADVVEQLHLHTQLRTALQQKEFQLHYQPQIDLVSGSVIGMEALIRWHHPEKGIISPALFIPVAEASGLIIPIGEWVLEEACRQARIWQKNGQAPFRVAVNLSALQFQRGNIIDTVSKALERSGLPPGMLELELTESILLQDMESALKTIHDLKVLGVQLSIDDFGTGYSSLSYLKRLKVDKLKIDQSFVRDLVTDIDDMAIVSAIIQLGKNLQLRVIAEGVETAEQLSFLSSHECDEAQGYFFSRPLAPADLEVWLAARNQLMDIA